MAEVNDDLLDRLRDAFYRAGRVAATDDLRNRLAAAGSDLAVALRAWLRPSEVLRGWLMCGVAERAGCCSF